MPDHYTYPGSDVLVNKLGIMDYEHWKFVETEVIGQRMGELCVRDEALGLGVGSREDAHSSPVWCERAGESTVPTRRRCNSACDSSSTLQLKPLFGWCVARIGPYAEVMDAALFADSSTSHRRSWRPCLTPMPHSGCSRD